MSFKSARMSTLRARLAWGARGERGMMTSAPLAQRDLHSLETHLRGLRRLVAPGEARIVDVEARLVEEPRGELPAVARRIGI
ncbi:MAG TPA: hypothetical protein VLJ84_09265, partial [Usitatibacter sp.]|nr:hypothetical protein [Usitatibacter sp.]